VNVASRCGFTTDNYNLLRNLSQYRSSQFEILIFPCNQFGLQEPGDAQMIENFARSRGYGGIIMSKGDVNGLDARPTFKFIRSQTANRNIDW
jgi:glutathione peroxidase